MVNDSQRREAANNVRHFLSAPQNEYVWGVNGLQTVGRLVGTSLGESILLRLADLIDRPFCFDTDNKDSKFFTCSVCGFSDSKITINPFTLSLRSIKPGYHYCPNCGDSRE